MITHAITHSVFIFSHSYPNIKRSFKIRQKGAFLPRETNSRHRLREKKSAKHIYNKELIFRIYKELLQLKNKNIFKNPTKNEQKI